VEQQKERGDRSGEIEDELYDVGPDHGFHTAFEGIQEHKPMIRRTEVRCSVPNAPSRQARCRDAHTFRESASDEERRSATAFTLAPNLLSISW